LNTLDIIIAILLVVGMVRGYRRGFLITFLSILAFILGIIGAFALLRWGMSLLLDYFQIHGKILPYLSFFLLFLAIVFLVHLLGRALKKVIDFTPLGIADNAGGALMGLFTWCFGISIVLWMGASYENSFIMRVKDTSLFFPYLVGFGPKVVGWFSFVLPFAGDLFEQLKTFLENTEV
jgi:membrane protein required for colicin V production